MMRLFIALPIEQHVRDYMGEVIEKLKPSGGKVKWVNPKNMHLTVRFLGDTEEKVVPKLTVLMDKVTGEFQSVTVMVDRLGGFPNLRKPRVIWAGINGDTDPIIKMARQIELGVRKLRFEKDSKGFKPHLTLGRVRDTRQLGDLPSCVESLAVTPTSLKLDRIVLYKSTLTRTGPIYDTLHTSMLGIERFGD